MNPTTKYTPHRTHGRQKSLSDAFKTIRTRKGSMSQNAQEIAEALKAPVSWTLISLCSIWYATSALSNTSAKNILNAFDRPSTLTMTQFAFVCGFCLIFHGLANQFPQLKDNIKELRHGIRYPTKKIIKTTIPLACFSLAGHLLSHRATSRIPVSLVHTIKGLSPLFTVFAYRWFYNIRYPTSTYLSLVPLTVGVMFACSGAPTSTGNFLGIIYAFSAAVIFVTQNIFSKRLFNEAKEAEDASHARPGQAASDKLDKLNLLFYSSTLAMLLSTPFWFVQEGWGMMSEFVRDGHIDITPRPGKPGMDGHLLFLEFFKNGVFHFLQNIIAFVLLSITSPVTYSVASLIKRVAVVAWSLLYFRNSTTYIQGFGIALTFFGLYLYDRTGHGGKADEKAQLTGIKEEPLLPVVGDGSGDFTATPLNGHLSSNGLPFNSISSAANPYLNGAGRNNGLGSLMDGVGGRQRADSNSRGRRTRGSSMAATVPWSAKAGDVKAA